MYFVRNEYGSDYFCFLRANHSTVLISSYYALLVNIWQRIFVILSIYMQLKILCHT